MNLYDKNGYLDMERIISLPVPFIFVTGERGGGKTYGAIKHFLQTGEKFALMRRTQTQADMINAVELSPFKSPCQDMNMMYTCGNIAKGIGGVYPAEKDTDGKLHIVGEEFSIVLALSTIANIRGFDASDIDYMVYDEFIPEKTARPIKEEAVTFFNAYETMNRNRELQGRQPLKCILLANSFDLTNPLFMHLKLVTRAMRMLETGTEFFMDRKRGLALIISQSSPVAQRKKATALYQLVGEDSDFTKFALRTQFVNDMPENIRSCPLREHKIICTIGEISIYKHKSFNSYYITTHCAGTPKDVYTTSDSDTLRFQRQHGYLWSAYLRREIFFENYMVQAIFKKLFKLT